MFGQYQQQMTANPYYAQQGLLSQQPIVSPQQAALLSQPSLLHQAALLNPQQQLAHHTGLLPQQALLQQSLAGQAHGQNNSLLGSPPARMQVNPALLSRALLNQALINNQLKPKLFNNRAPYKPILKPKVQQPLKPEDTMSQLEKLIPEFDDADKFTATSKEFIDLLLRGLSKETAPKFFEILQKLSTLIGSPAHNSVSLWRVFDGAYAKRTLFSNGETEELTKWKGEVDAKIKPKSSVFVKRPSDDQFDPIKRQRANGASVEDILLKHIDTLEDEVSKLRDELTQIKKKHGREMEQIRIAVGIPVVDEEELPDTTIPNPEVDVSAETVSKDESTILDTSVQDKSPNTLTDTDLNSSE